MNIVTEGISKCDTETSKLFYGWVNLAVLWLAYLLVTVPFIYTFGIIVSDMSASIGLTMTAAAGGYTCYQLTNALIAPLVGKLVITWGPKRILMAGCAAMLMAFVVRSAILINHSAAMRPHK